MSAAPNASQRRQRVFVAHHFWAHYRADVMRSLGRDGVHDYTFVGDTRDPNGSIRAADIDALLASGKFIRTPLKTFLKGKLTWQRGMIAASLRRDVDAFIYLGHYGHVSTWIAATLARLTGKRVLFWTHGYTHEDRGLKRVIRKLFYSIPHALMFYGHYGKNIAVTRMGFSPERIHVIYNSLSLNAQREAIAGVTRSDLVALRTQLFGDAEVPVVVCIIRLLAARRLDLVIEAVARLSAAGKPVNILLVGDGPAQADLEALAQQHGVRVHFFGPCYDENMLARLTMLANATVCPGPVGLTAIQSLTYGTPVITNDDWDTQMPEFETITPGKTGDFFNAGDVDDLADKIARWTRTPWPASHVATDCREIVDKIWNATMQRRVIDRAVSGLDADDLFPMREPDTALAPPARNAPPDSLK